MRLKQALTAAGHGSRIGKPLGSSELAARERLFGGAAAAELPRRAAPCRSHRRPGRPPRSRRDEHLPREDGARAQRRSQAVLSLRAQRRDVARFRPPRIRRQRASSRSSSGLPVASNRSPAASASGSTRSPTRVKKPSRAHRVFHHGCVSSWPISGFASTFRSSVDSRPAMSAPWKSFLEPRQRPACARTWTACSIRAGARLSRSISTSSAWP